MEYGCLNKCVRKENFELWEKINNLACHEKLFVRANRTTSGGFVGRTSYVLLKNKNFINRNSQHCIFYSEAPHSRFYQPSIKQEKEALEQLINKLERIQNESKF